MTIAPINAKFNEPDPALSAPDSFTPDIVCDCCKKQFDEDSVVFETEANYFLCATCYRQEIEEAYTETDILEILANVHGVPHCRPDQARIKRDNYAGKE